MTRLEEQNVLLLLYLIYFDYCEIILSYLFTGMLSFTFLFDDKQFE